MNFVKLAAPLAVAALLAAAGCGKKEPPPQSAGSASSSSRPQQSDYAKPNLTEAKVTRFIDSLQEQHNPLEFIFKKGGMITNWRELESRASELNVFARRYGFADYADYVDCWGRIMVGEMQVFAAGFSVGAKDMLEKQIQSAEESLKKPGLSAEERQMYTEQLATAKESMAEYQKPQQGGLNTQDLELVKKFLPRIQDATKKYKSAE